MDKWHSLWSLKIRVKEIQYADEKSVGTLQTKLKRETLAGKVTIIFHHKGTIEYCGYVVSTSASHSSPRFKSQSSFCYPRWGFLCLIHLQAPWHFCNISCSSQSTNVMSAFSPAIMLGPISSPTSIYCFNQSNVSEHFCIHISYAEEFCLLCHVFY